LVFLCETTIGYDPIKEQIMIKLTDEQLMALDALEQPTVAVDPRTGQEYLLIRREIHEKVRLVLRPFGRGWDSSADDELVQVHRGTMS
jgi:hypothetical protein